MPDKCGLVVFGTQKEPELLTGRTAHFEGLGQRRYLLSDADKQALDAEHPHLASAQDLTLSVSTLRTPVRGTPVWDAPVHGAPKDMYGRGSAVATTRRLAERRDSVLGGGVLVGVVDTGWRPHWWLDGAVLAAPDDTEHLEKAAPELPAEAGHGTFVSGLILQQAPAAGIWMERALSSAGDGGTMAVGEAARRLARRGVKIINLSLGSRDGDDSEYQEAAEQMMKGIFEACPDVVVVAAAGNLDEGQTPAQYWPASLPADTYPNIIAVGALDADGTDMASWSNSGGWLDFLAPGTDLMSTYVYHEPMKCAVGATSPRYSGWARWSGTSFATAVVSGAIARTMTEQDICARAAVDHLRETAPRHVRGVPVVERYRPPDEPASSDEVAA